MCIEADFDCGGRRKRDVVKLRSRKQPLEDDLQLAIQPLAALRTTGFGLGREAGTHEQAPATLQGAIEGVSKRSVIAVTAGVRHGYQKSPKSGW